MKERLYKILLKALNERIKDEREERDSPYGSDLDELETKADRIEWLKKVVEGVIENDGRIIDLLVKELMPELIAELEPKLAKIVKEKA